MNGNLRRLLVPIARMINFIPNLISQLFKTPPMVFTLDMAYYERAIDLSSVADRTRVSSLELVAREIYNKQIGGSVAEVGVFQGEFSKFINLLFPDRRIYLFDTFEGFDKKDLREDTEKGLFSLDQNFSSTNINLVLGKMPHPHMCIIKKGYFPETVGDLNDSFCFVSLDADLFNPIFEGLKYFYPRLMKGGYIFVHDYNNAPYGGVREAVKKFSEEYSDATFFPLSDWGGTLVIMK